jgi:cellobiose phosphorylase
MAEAMLGRGDRAYEYYRQVMPPIISEKVGPDVYLNEPYMFSSHVITDPDSRKGMATLSWLTGTVNWMYIVATQFILGIRPTLKGLMIQPCIPSTWTGFHAIRQYRGATYDIRVKTSQGCAEVRSGMLRV